MAAPLILGALAVTAALSLFKEERSVHRTRPPRFRSTPWRPDGEAHDLARMRSLSRETDRMWNTHQKREMVRLQQWQRR